MYMLRRRNGQSLIEFALAIPLLAILLIGLAEFGFVLYAHVQVTNATREAARAGSLYLSSRFHYSGCINQPSHLCPMDYGNGGDCWDIIPWVENALVQHLRNSDGCDAEVSDPSIDDYDDTIHAFGNLSPARCLELAAVGQPIINCWELQTLAVSGTPVPTASTDNVTWMTDRIGEPLEVTLLYRYEMPFVGNFLPILQNPVLIRKTVIVRIQNN